MTLAKPLEHYLKYPASVSPRGTCKLCGGHLSPTRKHIDKWNRKMRCDCDGIPFPHMRGQMAQPMRGESAGGPYFCEYFKGDPREYL